MAPLAAQLDLAVSRVPDWPVNQGAAVVGRVRYQRRMMLRSKEAGRSALGSAQWRRGTDMADGSSKLAALANWRFWTRKNPPVSGPERTLTGS